jgi:pimeloyl-ACP methyl ester carboxylesterase
MHYQITGQGYPVVLIHGFGEDGTIWQYQVAALQTAYRLIVPDLPGSGQSPLPDKPLTIESMAESIMELLTAKNINRCTLIGHSMGGYIALALAEKYPDKVDALVLFHSTAFADSAEKVNTRRRSIEFIQEYGATNFLQQSIPNLFGDSFKLNHPEKVASLIKKGISFSKEALIQYYEAMIQRPDRTSLLKAFQGPVLFIAGEKDKAVPLEDILRQCYLPAIAHIQILKDVAHTGLWEEKGLSNEILVKFLTENNVSGSIQV